MKDFLFFFDLEKKCIDMVVEVIFFLVKVFIKVKFFRVYSKFINVCIVNGDKKRWGDCLIVEVYGIFFYCVCYFLCLLVVFKFKEVDKI